MMWWWIVFGILSIILLSNVLGAKRLGWFAAQTPKTFPKVSLLIPVRNEEKNIPDLCASLKTLSYPNLEILFLDDHSEDATVKLIKAFDFKVIKGKRLPKGWIGKNWACDQLSKLATGKYFLFLDADVRMHDNTIEKLINRADLVTVFPKNKMKTVGEALTVPVINWMGLTFLSWPLAYGTTGRRFSSYAAANGQCVLIKRSMYNKIGGHKHIQFHLVEDIQLAREVKKKGGKVITVLGNKLLTCRPYHSFHEAFFGFSKNMYPAMGNFFIGLVFLAAMLFFFLPFIQFWFWPTIAVLIHAFIILLLSKQPPVIILLFPLQLIVWMFILLTSYYQTQQGVRRWKGRMY